MDCKKRGVQPVAGPLKEGDASIAPGKIDLFWNVNCSLLLDIAGLREESPPPKEHSPKFSPEPSKRTVKSAESASNDDLKSLDGLSTEVCEKTIKAAKFAIGCLQYKDKDGAIKYLQEALNLLTTH